MATLAFHVEADYDKVIKLRDEITRLEKALEDVSKNGSPEMIGELEGQLESCRKELKETVKAAAEFGSEVEKGFKDMSFGTVEEQINTLSYAIHENEEAINDSIRQLDRYKQEGEKAFAAGNDKALQSITQSINEQVTQIRDLTAETDLYRAALQSLTQGGGAATGLEGIRNTLSQIGTACEQQEQQLALLEEEYKKLNTTLVMSTETGSEEDRSIRSRMQAIQGEIVVRRQLLKELQGQSDKLEEEAGRMEKSASATMKAAEAHVSLRTRIRQLREAMADMRANGIDEQSEGYRQLAEELGRLQDIQGDIQKQGSTFANDERSFAGVTSGLQGVTGGFLAAQGAMALFGAGNKELQNILVKTQGLMAITNSLQQVSATLNKDSAFRLVTLGNARAWWNKLLAAGRGEQVADTAATAADTVAKEANTAAQTGNAAATTANAASQTAQTASAVAGTAANITLAGAFRMVGAAIKSIPVFGWIATAIAAIVAVTSKLVSASRKAKKAQEELYKSIAEEVYKPVAGVQQLAAEWDKLGDNLEAKEKFITDNKKRFDELGVSINDVHDAENLLIENKDAFVNAMMAKAKASVAQEQYMEGLKKELELQQKVKDMETKGQQTITRTIYAGMYGTTQTTEEANPEYVKAKDELKKQREENEKIFKGYQDANKDYADKLKESGIDQAQKIKEGTRAALKAQISALQTQLDENLVIGTDEYKAAMKKLEDLQEEYSKASGNVKTTRSETEKTNDEQVRLQQRANETLLALRRKNQQDEINLMEEGAEKRLAQIEYDYRKEIAAVKKQEEELRVAQNGSLTEEQTKEISKAYSIADDSYNKAKEKIDRDAEKEEKKRIEAEEKAWNEHLIKYGDYMEKRAAIQQKYSKLIADAATAGEAATLTKEMEDALYQIDKAAEGTTSLIAQLFADASDKSVKEIQAILDKTELLMSYLEATKDENGNATINGETVSRQYILDLGISEETLTKLSESSEEMESFRKMYEKLKNALKGKSSLTNFAKAIGDAWKKFKEGDWKGGLQGMINAINDLLPVIKQFGEDMGTIFGNDEIGDKVKGMADAFDGLTTAAGGFFEMFSGNPDGILAATSGIASMVSALDGLFGADYSRYNELVEQYSGLLDIWDELIDKKREYISIDYGAEAVNSATEALDLLERQKEVTQELAEARLTSGSSAGSHSIGYRMWKGSYDYNGVTWHDVAKEIEDEFNVAFSSMSDMLYWDPEVLEQVKEEYTGLWAVMDDDFRDYLDSLIEYGETADDIIEQLKEAMTDVSFDSFRDSFTSAIMDMEHTTADFAQDFEDMMKEAVINSLISNTYASRLQKWYDDFAAAMESENALTPDEQQELKDDYMSIVEDAKKEIAELYDTMGWSTTSTQSASNKGFETMSQDTAEELSGRFTALQIAGEDIRNEVTEMSGKLDESNAIFIEIHSIADETRGILADSYLELQEINENTSNSARYLADAVNYLRKVKENTDKL